jgi:hypothetical protein
MKVLEKRNSQIARSISPRTTKDAALKKTQCQREKREEHEGKQLPSVGTGMKNGKTTISGSNGPPVLAHIEYSAHDNPRIP